MSSPANATARGSQPGSVPPVQETGYLSRPGGRIGYDVAGDGAVLVLVPGEVLGGPAVVVGEQDPDFADPRAEADWIARALRAQVVMVPEAGHYPQSQQPDITVGAVLHSLESVRGRA